MEAEASSALTAHLCPTPCDRTKAIKNMETHLLAVLDDPAWMAMKAVDPETGEVASYAVWKRVVSSESCEARARNWELAGMNFQLMSPSPSTRNERKEGKSIMEFITAERVKFMDDWARDMSYVELIGLATSVRFQRRGYATALLEWGHQRADEERRVSFLMGTPVGRYLYASKGWKEVGEIKVDLNEGGERGDTGWGVYKFYHMIRLPRVAAS